MASQSPAGASSSGARVFSACAGAEVGCLVTGSTIGWIVYERRAPEVTRGAGGAFPLRPPPNSLTSMRSLTCRLPRSASNGDAGSRRRFTTLGGYSTFFHDKRLQYHAKPDRPDPVYAK